MSDYEPYECFNITFPDGKQTTFGRCTRTGISWDNEFELFRVNSDVEEISTRSQDISMDYDFFHSHEISLECGNDYEMKVVPHDQKTAHGESAEGLKPENTK